MLIFNALTPVAPLPIGNDKHQKYIFFTTAAVS